MKRIVLTLFLLLAAAAFLTAGGKNENAGEARVYNIMFPLIFPEVPPADAPVMVALKKLSATPFEFQFVPTDGYSEKLNISIAAGELPDSFVVTNPKHNTFISAVNAGIIWELTDALKSSRNLSKNMSAQVLRNTNIGGKNYFIPRTNFMVRYGYNFRKDWLANLGLKTPVTMDEVYTVIKAFATQDPDKNGKHDTYGLITAGDAGGIWQLWIPAAAFGAGNGWVEENGKLVPTFTTRPFMDTIRFYKRLYDEKLMNQDFATIRAERALEILNTEAGGFFFDTTDRLTSRFEVLVKTKQVENPDIQLEDLWDFTTEVKSVDGSVRLPATAGASSGFAFPRTQLKTEAEFRKMFEVFDVLDSNEAKDILNWGIEGRNFRFQDGKAVSINTDNFAREVGLFQQLLLTGVTVPGNIAGVKRPLQERINATQLVNHKYGISDPTFPLISQTQTSRGADLQKIMADAQIQWVMGQIDEAGYMAAIERWKSAGGQAVMDEFTAAWKASQ